MCTCSYGNTCGSGAGPSGPAPFFQINANFHSFIHKIRILLTRMLLRLSINGNVKPISIILGYKLQSVPLADFNANINSLHTSLLRALITALTSKANC